MIRDKRIEEKNAMLRELGFLVPASPKKKKERVKRLKNNVDIEKTCRRSKRLASKSLYVPANSVYLD